MLHSCDIAIFASECETFSNILREKVASGVPIICAGVEPLFEVAGRFAKFYDARSPLDLAQKIDEFICEQQFEDKIISLESRYLFLKDYQWKNCINRYNLLLKQEAPSLFL